jgi:phage replication O-like protein O
MPDPDRFVRLSTDLLEALMRVRLTGTQWRIILWVIRHTYGWNRNMASFSWYRIAKDLSAERGGVVRAGNRLLAAKLLCTQEGQLGIQKECWRWVASILVAQRDDSGQLWMDGIAAEARHRKPMTPSIEVVAVWHRKRCQESSVFRRAKDRIKDNSKTYKDRISKTVDGPHRLGAPENTSRQLFAGSAEPVPGKYDGISEN